MITLEDVQDQLRSLRLKDMAGALSEALSTAHQERQGHLTFLAGLVAQQLAATKARSLKKRIDKARLPVNMTFDRFDWGFQPGLNVEAVKDLRSLHFITNHSPVLLLGKTGTGKTHIAAALGLLACEAGLRVAFITLHKLLATLYASLADDTTDECIARLARLDLLIIDNVSFIRTKLEYPSLFLDLVSACQERVALIVTANISFEQWGTALGNPAITSSIVDRLFHRACVINIRPGRSYWSEGPHAPKTAPKTK